MAKIKTPFFSMGAQGSVGGSITAQKSASRTLLRGKPLPTDPYSLPQAYQRWLYEDYAHLWTQQSTATRQTYATAGTRFHLTGFQYWIKYQLTNMPDIAGLWHMDKPDHTICLDHSPNDNNGTVFGATPSPGIIDGSLLLDATNDIILVPSAPSLDITSAISLQCFVYLKSYNAGGAVTDRSTLITKKGSYYMTITKTTGKLASYFMGLWPAHIESNTQVPLNQWVHCAITWDGTTVRWYIAGNLDKSAARAGTITTDPRDLGIGAEPSPIRITDGYIDMAIVHNRAPDDTEILRHSLRRYPPQ